MTGEITLRGMVLPVGGVKEKLLAAHRAGIKRVLLPERNQKDLVDVPDQAKSELEMVFVRRVEDVLAHVLREGPHESHGIPTGRTGTFNRVQPPPAAPSP